MPFHIQIIPRTLQFKFDARTSRGAISEHQVYYLKLFDDTNPEKYGLGECAPLAGLSPEYQTYFSKELQTIIQELNQIFIQEDTSDLQSVLNRDNFNKYSSVYFALETAWLDFKNGGNKVLFPSEFTAGNLAIPINGLIWMGNKIFMQDQIKEKLEEGFTCLKLKIGALDFNTELEILKSVRQFASPEFLTIRLDANGAFRPEDAMNKINQLAAFGIHSLEQPIATGQLDAMRLICAESPVPIALDEELIGLRQKPEMLNLLEFVNPPYIILKPTLAGGLSGCATWIDLAQQKNIDWWITSALESNIGLNAISQFAAQYSLVIPQGLGTGKLYHNNIPSPLTISQGNLRYNTAIKWGEVE